MSPAQLAAPAIALSIWPYIVLVLSPSARSAAIATMAMSEAIMAYSIEVAPPSSLQNRWKI